MEHLITKKNIKTWLMDKKTQLTTTFILASAYYTQPVVVFADGAKKTDAGTNVIDNLVKNWLADWLTQIGGVVMLIGGIQFALAWQRQDSESKSSAMLTVMAGAMIAGLSTAYTMFF